jgi:uncharacterized protein YcaQ
VTQPIERLSAAQARRIALAAQGFADRPPPGEPTKRHLARMIARVGLIQIDSVNVLVRSHYLPVFARLGPYARALLDEAAWGKNRTLFEYWGHEASLIPLAMQPLFRWRMAQARDGIGVWSGLKRLYDDHGPFIESVAAEIDRRGPIGAGELEVGGKAQNGKTPGGWWGWSDGKRALEWLFWTGRVTTATRRGFERLYDLTERALPRAVVEAPTPSPADAHRALIRIAAHALGVATEGDLRDYFRMGPTEARPRIAELVEAGELIPSEVQGWDRPAYLAPDAARPRKVAANALLSPFDSLVWRRERTERLFDFRYRLEIYTPAHKRQHGYYVLPFLQGEAITARLDLKADRKASALLVKRAHAQPGHELAAIAAPLGVELARMAGWLGLADVCVESAEPLADALRALPPHQGAGGRAADPIADAAATAAG